MTTRVKSAKFWTLICRQKRRKRWNQHISRNWFKPQEIINQLHIKQRDVHIKTRRKVRYQHRKSRKHVTDLPYEEKKKKTGIYFWLFYWAGSNKIVLKNWESISVSADSNSFLVIYDKNMLWYLICLSKETISTFY